MFSLSHSNKEDLFEKILKERMFKIKDYEKYIVASLKDEKNKLVYIIFDLNNDGITDVIAKTNITKKKGDKYFTNKYATFVGIDRNEDGNYETFYFDKNGDNKFEREERYIEY